jgi:hypothetical protein
MLLAVCLSIKSFLAKPLTEVVIESAVLLHEDYDVLNLIDCSGLDRDTLSNQENQGYCNSQPKTAGRFEGLVRWPSSRWWGRGTVEKATATKLMVRWTTADTD